MNNPLTHTDPSGAVLQDAGGGGSIASAVLPALGIVGLDPTANALNGTCTGSCYHSAFGQLLNTAWAADALRQNGVDVNLLRWSGIQREMLANIYPGEVKYGWQSPSTSDESRYTSGIIAAVGVGAALTVTSNIAFGGTNIIVQDHGLRHLEGTGLDNSEVSAAISKNILETGAPESGFFKGSVQVQGQTIDYNGYVLSGGDINVGTLHVADGEP